MARATVRTSRGARNGSTSARRRPDTLSPKRYSFAASLMCTSARPRSYSYMPDSKMPATVKRRLRGTNPAGVTLPSGAISTTDCPCRTPSSSASADPRMMRYLPASRSVSEPDLRRSPSPTAFTSSSGNTPRTMAPATGDQATGLDERHRGLHARRARGLLLLAAPVGDVAVVAADGGVRGHRQHAVAQLLFESVEHRQHDDQHGHAYAQAEHRHERHEGHEAAAVLRAQVTYADEPLV